MGRITQPSAMAAADIVAAGGKHKAGSIDYFNAVAGGGVGLPHGPSSVQEFADWPFSQATALRRASGGSTLRPRV